MFKVNNSDARHVVLVSLFLWYHYDVFVINFEQIFNIVLVSPMLIPNKLMPARMMTLEHFNSEIMTLVHNVV